MRQYFCRDAHENIYKEKEDWYIQRRDMGLCITITYVPHKTSQRLSEAGKYSHKLKMIHFQSTFDE